MEESQESLLEGLRMGIGEEDGENNSDISQKLELIKNIGLPNVEEGAS